MNPLLANNLEKIKIYCRQYDVEKLYAFGSATKERCQACTLDKLNIYCVKSVGLTPCDMCIGALNG
jgi:hypothetical protein